MSRRRLSRRALLAGAVGLAGVAGGATAHELSRTANGRRAHRLENEFLSLDLDPVTGGIVQVANRRRGLELVDPSFPGASPPWRVFLGDHSVLERPRTFDFERQSDGATLRWRSERGHSLQARVTLKPGDESARFEIALEGAAGSPAAEVLEHPIVRGIGRLSATGERDRLLHPHATGFLFRDPFELFAEEGEGPERGLLFSPYPEGFSGAAMQMMAYFAEDTGGFYFGAEDSTGAQKWLNFHKNDDGYLQASVMHGAADAESGVLRPSYPVVVGALEEGCWTKAADRYKSWAVRQPWCEGGRLGDRRDESRWLFEDVGLVTFGVNASHDRSAWLEAFHLIAGTSVLHVLGPNWTDETQDYQDTFPGGIDDWLPARFSRVNTATIRAHNDRFAPFQFDLLFGIYGSEHEAGVQALQAIPAPILSFDSYSFPFLCPVTSFLRNLHGERDRHLARDYDVDGVYYDISANNVIKQCFDSSHGHARGGGEFMTNAYRELYARSKELMAGSADGRYVPQGTEMINEVFVDRLDFYQARAEASPASAFEGDQFRDWIKAGRAEKVPLFAYVYHEYGPVRTDGWGKLSREQGELFYWIAARVLVWGGLFQLNYEFSPLEVLDGKAEPLDQHYFPLVERHYQIDRDKAAFVGEIARARTGFANPYLAYGAMLPPLAIESPKIDLDWFHYNCPPGWPAYEDRGTHTVDAVVHAAWRYAEAAAIVLVNVDRTAREVAVPLRTSALRLDGDAPRTVEYVTASGREPLGSFRDGQELRRTLPSRKVVLVEVKPA